MSQPARLDLAYGPDPRHRFDLYPPELPSPTGVSPAVVYIHGGGWREGSKEQVADGSPVGTDVLRQAWTSAGFAVAAPNYRLSDQAPYPAQPEDLTRFLAHLREHATDLGVAAEAIVVSGDSAGGHLAELTGLQHPAWVRGVVSLFGVSDLGALVADRVAAGCGPGGTGADSAEGVLLGGHDAATHPELAWESSPMGHVTPSAPAMLLLHGTADCVVPDAQSRRLAAALKEVGVSVDLVLVDGAGHSDPAFMSSSILEQVVSFSKRQVAEFLP